MCNINPQFSRPFLYIAMDYYSNNPFGWEVCGCHFLLAKGNSNDFAIIFHITHLQIFN